MLYKKDYLKPKCEVITTKPVTLLTASFTSTMDEEDIIVDDEEIL